VDPIAERFRSIEWRYAPQDARALSELEDRVAATARRRALITYSDLVRGVVFNLPNLHDPMRQIDVREWEDLDRAIVGDFLGYMSMRSYDLGEFFSSALVVSKMNGQPGEGFYALLKELGLIASSKTDKAMYLWAEHVDKAHAWYAMHREGLP
jgi:hypothetical protein